MPPSTAKIRRNRAGDEGHARRAAGATPVPDEFQIVQAVRLVIHLELGGADVHRVVAVKGGHVLPLPAENHTGNGRLTLQAPSDIPKEARVGEFVRLEVAEGIGTIRLDRPKMNALNRQVQEELREAATAAAVRRRGPRRDRVRRASGSSPPAPTSRRWPASGTPRWRPGPPR